MCDESWQADELAQLSTCWREASQAERAPPAAYSLLVEPDEIEQLIESMQRKIEFVPEEMLMRPMGRYANGNNLMKYEHWCGRDIIDVLPTL